MFKSDPKTICQTNLCIMDEVTETTVVGIHANNLQNIYKVLPISSEAHIKS